MFHQILYSFAQINIHLSNTNIGKNVTYTTTVDPSTENTEKTEIESLKEQLKNAVKEQRFEDAAVIRDKIKALGEEK